MTDNSNTDNTEQLIKSHPKKIGLILSGGGARAAYQVGVMKAIADIRGRQARNPFSVLCGTSAGAINAVALAASSNNFMLAVKKLEKMWSELNVQDIYRADAKDLAVSIGRLVFSLFNQGVGLKKPLALLDNDPLRELLKRNIQYRNIQKRIDAGYLDAVSVTASGYESGESVTFFQAKEGITKWRSGRRAGVPTTFSEKHLIASSAIPAIMPAEKVHREYFGDGALSQLSPISPALRLGAEKVFVIGARTRRKPGAIRFKSLRSPSLAQMIGHVFTSAFIDSLEYDIDMTRRQNELIKQIQGEQGFSYGGRILKPVELFIMRPSVEFNDIALKHMSGLSKAMQVFMKMIGANKGGSMIASFLLFHGDFCRELIELGYADAMERKDDIREFICD